MQRNGPELNRGKIIVIVGAGTIGNCTAQIAVARGANVLITDIKDGRLQYAQDCGIKNCCNTNRVSLAQAIDGAFGSAGADVLIDCCGIPEMLQNMVCCAQNASRIVLVGTYGRDILMNMTHLQRGEIDIISVMQYVRRHYLQVFDLMQRGKLHLEGFIGARFPLSGLQQAFDYLHEPNTDVMKVAIMVQ